MICPAASFDAVLLYLQLHRIPQLGRGSESRALGQPLTWVTDGFYSLWAGSCYISCIFLTLVSQHNSVKEP